MDVTFLLESVFGGHVLLLLDGIFDLLRSERKTTLNGGRVEKVE
jgi:hypothetical protein